RGASDRRGRGGGGGGLRGVGRGAGWGGLLDEVLGGLRLLPAGGVREQRAGRPPRVGLTGERDRDLDRARTVAGVELRERDERTLGVAIAGGRLVVVVREHRLRAGLGGVSGNRVARVRLADPQPAA